MIRFIDEDGIIEPIGMKNGEAELAELGVETAIMLFSTHLFDELDDKFSAREIGHLNGAADLPVYVINRNGKNVAVIKSMIGAPAAAATAEEMLANKSLKNLVAFGICGALTDVPPRSFIVPDRAFRDEGTSGHYRPASDFAELKNSDYVARALKDMGLSAVKGGVWTTDAFYRETRTRRDEMRKNGCVAVDMECSALQCVCDYRKKNFYAFFITADSLSGEKWEPNYILDIDKHAAPDTLGVAAAVELACGL